MFAVQGMGGFAEGLFWNRGWENLAPTGARPRAVGPGLLWGWEELL